MTHDETALARWLDQPGTEPDASLDPEVLEAVYALRPELVPAPRVTADDILASLTAGPLAVAPTGLAPGASEAPSGFPSAAPQPANRSFAAWGGWGGIGLALAAAATFALVALPSLNSPMNDAPLPTTSMQTPAAPAASPEPEPEEAIAQDQAPPAAKPAAQRAAAPPVAAAASPAEPAYDMAKEAPLRERSLIPELAEDGVAAAEAPEVDLDGLRAQALPADAEASWASSVSKSEAKRVQGVFDEAATFANTDPRKAGDTAATVIAAPAPVAHAAALLSSAYYLQAGDNQAAASVCLRGLQLRDGSAAWSKLAVRYADLTRGADPDGASQWYLDAARANAAR